MDEATLIKLVQERTGASAKQARAAMQKMGGLGAMLGTEASAAETDPKKRLRMKLAEKQRGRTNRVAAARAHEKAVAKREAREVTAADARANKKRNQKKKLRELQKKLGAVTQDRYLAAMARLQQNDYARSDDRAADQNLIALYQKQQGFTGTVDMTELDALLD